MKSGLSYKNMDGDKWRAPVEVATMEEEKEDEEMDSDEVSDTELNVESDDNSHFGQGFKKDSTLGFDAPVESQAARALSMTESARTGPSRRNNEGGISENSSAYRIKKQIDANSGKEESGTFRPR